MKKIIFVLFLTSLSLFACGKKDKSSEDVKAVDVKSDNISALKNENVEILEEVVVDNNTENKLVNMDDRFIENPTDTAIFFNYIINNKQKEVDEMIAKGMDVNIVDDYGQTPLNAAVSAGQHDMIRHLLKKGAKANASKGMIPLSAAIYNDDDKAFDILIKEGKADPYLVNDGFWIENPVYTAVSEGNIVMLQKLIDTGVNLNYDFSKYKADPLLIYAIKNSNNLKRTALKDVVAFLILNKVNINQQSMNGDTPLITAIETRNIPVFNALILSKADISIQNNRGETPLDVAHKLSKYIGDSEPQQDIKELIAYLEAETEKLENKSKTK